MRDVHQAERELEAAQADVDHFEYLYRGIVDSASRVEEIAVERFAVTPRRVQNAARRLWGRSTGDEFMERVEPTLATVTARRSSDVIRGHVTRELLRELGEVLNRGGR